MDHERPLFVTFRPEDNAASAQPGPGAAPRAEQPPEQPPDAQGRVGRGAVKGPAPQLPTPALSATRRYRAPTPKALQGPSSTAQRPGPNPIPLPPRLGTGTGGLAPATHHPGGGSRASSGTLCPASPEPQPLFASSQALPGWPPAGGGAQPELVALWARTRLWFEQTQAGRLGAEGELPAWFHGFLSRR